MAPVPKKLSRVSYSGAYPTVRITKGQFEQLQEIYGVTLSLGDRRKVRAIANRFLRGKVWELVSEPRSNTRRAFEKIQEAIGPFVLFAEGALLGKGDSVAEVESLLAEHYKTVLVAIQHDHVRIRVNCGELEPPDPQSLIYVSLNPTVLMNVAHGLVHVLSRVRCAIEQDEKTNERGFAPGLAFHDFLWQLRDWARAAGHPISPFRQATIDDAADAPDKLPSPFSEFIFALNQMFRTVDVTECFQSIEGDEIPSLEEKVESPRALAERLKAVATEANARAPQGGR